MLMSAAGCREQVFEPVRNGLVTTATVAGNVRVVTKADLLFVVDDSRSMRNEQDKLAAGFGALVDQLDALDPPVDWQVGVMTTSVDEGFGPCDPADPSSPAQCSAAFGGTGFTCDEGRCSRRFPDLAGRLVAASGNPLVLRRSELSAAELVRVFGENVRSVDEGARQEQPLRAVRMALEEGLQGFRRSDARLVVVVATDEDDCSDSTQRILSLEETDEGLVDRCAEAAAAGTGLDDVGEWIAWFRDSGDVALGVIAGLEPGTGRPGLCVDEACAAECDLGGRAECQTQCSGALLPSRCVHECIAECESFCGAQAPGLRLVQAARAMSGPVASVCESDYAPALSQLARVLGIPETIELPSAPADTRAVFFTVFRGDDVIACREGADWNLDRTGEVPALIIEQNGACRLLPDDRWEVRYVAE